MVVFARRTRLSLLVRARDLIWPRIGFRRAIRYVAHRVARLPGSPHAIAGGLAWGIAISFTPLLGLHIFLGGLGAWLTRGSILAAAIGTAAGNPWTFPFIWALVYEIGITILDIDGDAAPPLDSLRVLFEELWPLLGDWVQWLFGLKESSEIVADDASRQIVTTVRFVLWPLLVGSVPAMIVVWLASYYFLKSMIASYQRARRLRRARKHKRSGEDEAGVSNIC